MEFHGENVIFMETLWDSTLNISWNFHATWAKTYENSTETPLNFK